MVYIRLEKEKTNGTYCTTRNTSFCLQVGFFFPSALCIVDSSTSEYASSLLFLFLRKVELTTNKHGLFVHSTIKSSLSSYPSKQSPPPSPSKENQTDIDHRTLFYCPTLPDSHLRSQTVRNLVREEKNIKHFR